MQNDKKLEKTEGWKQLFDTGWFTDLENSSFHLRIYSVINFSQLSFDFGNLKLDGLIKIGIGEMRDLDFYLFRHCHYQNADSKENVIKGMKFSYDLPPTVNLFISTPSKIDGEKIKEDILQRRYALIETCLRTCFGNNILKSCLMDDEVNPSSGEKQFTTDFIFLPQVAEGPFLTKENGLEMQELIKTIHSFNDTDSKNRILISSEIFSIAHKQIDKLLFYWMSFDILSNARDSRDICKVLEAAYEYSKNEIDENFKFKKIKDLRNDIAHQGKRIQIHPDLERYLQCMYWDLLRQTLKLSPKRHMENMLSSSTSYNLSQIDL